MTKNISEEELLLRKRARRRLVGAAVLVLVSIIVLPAIFDEPQTGSEKQEIAINLPIVKPNDSTQVKELVDTESFNDDDPSIDFQNQMKTAPQVESIAAEPSRDQKRTPIPGIKPKIDRAPTIQREAGSALSAATVNTATTASSAAITTATATTPAAPAVMDAGKGFVIQLGAYSDQAKAKQQQTNLLSNGFKAYIETHNEVTRVRIGSFATRAAAENEIKRLKKIGLDGVIIPR